MADHRVASVWANGQTTSVSQHEEVESKKFRALSIHWKSVDVKLYKPKVSVCIPTYNRARMLKEAIQSVLGQTLDRFELVICDNHSQDDTQSIVESFHDNRIRYIRHNKNIGLVKNLNHCLGAARCRYITIFHDDDIMLPDNLLLKARALDENPGVGFVHSHFYEIDDKGTILECKKQSAQPQAYESIQRGHDFLSGIMLGNNSPNRASLFVGTNFVNPPSVMLRKECYTSLGGFNDQLSFTTDYEYWMRISLYYDVMFLSIPLVKYRRHGGSGTCQYTTPIKGLLALSIRGLEEEYTAKQIILERAKDIYLNWKDLRKGVVSRLCAQLDVLVENLLVDRCMTREERQALIRLARRFPEIVVHKSGVKLLIRTMAGPEALRRAQKAFAYLRYIAR